MIVGTVELNGEQSPPGHPAWVPLGQVQAGRVGVDLRKDYRWPSTEFFSQKIGCFQHGSLNNGIKHTMLPCIDLKKTCYLKQMWLSQCNQDAFHNSVRSWSTSSLWSLGVYHRLYPHDVSVTWPLSQHWYISQIYSIKSNQVISWNIGAKNIPLHSKLEYPISWCSIYIYIPIIYHKNGISFPQPFTAWGHRSCAISSPISFIALSCSWGKRQLLTLENKCKTHLLMAFNGNLNP